MVLFLPLGLGAVHASGVGAATQLCLLHHRVVQLL